MSTVVVSWAAIAAAVLVAPTRAGAGTRYLDPMRPLAPFALMVGARLRGLAGRPSDPERDQAVGRIAITAAAVAAVSPGLAVLVGSIALIVPAWASRRAARRRAATLDRELVIAVDLIAVAFESGQSPLGALRSVTERLTAVEPGSVLAPAIAVALAQHNQGLALDRALRQVGEHLGPGPTRLFEAIDAHRRLGASITESLSGFGEELRRDRRRRIETQARRLPVKMLLPLVGCVLPAFVLLTVAPVVIDSLTGLRL